MALIVCECLLDERRQRVVITAAHVAACRSLKKGRTELTLVDGATFIVLEPHTRVRRAWAAARARHDPHGILVLD
jgi:hypothetical protein